MLNVSINYVLKLLYSMLAIQLVNAISFNTLSELLVKYTYTLNIKSLNNAKRNLRLCRTTYTRIPRTI